MPVPAGWSLALQPPGRLIEIDAIVAERRCGQNAEMNAARHRAAAGTRQDRKVEPAIGVVDLLGSTAIIVIRGVRLRGEIDAEQAVHRR